MGMCIRLITSGQRVKEKTHVRWGAADGRWAVKSEVRKRGDVAVRVVMGESDWLAEVREKCI